MDKKQIIEKIVLNNLFEQNDEELRNKMGYEIRNSFEKNKIDYTTISLHTPSDLIDKNLIKIVVDEEEFIIGIKNSESFFTSIGKPEIFYYNIEQDEDN